MPALLLGPLGKLLGIGILIAVLIGVGEWHGRKSIQLRWDAAVAAQAIEVAENIIKNAENTARIESEFQKKLDAAKGRTKIIKKEVIKYVEGPSEKCILTPEFERVFDGISRLYDPAKDGVPSATDSTGVTIELSQAPLTDVAILRAYEGLVVELFGLWETYDALRAWVRSSHTIAKEGAGR